MMISLENGQAQTVSHIKIAFSKILRRASYSVKMIE